MKLSGESRLSLDGEDFQRSHDRRKHGQPNQNDEENAQETHWFFLNDLRDDDGVMRALEHIARVRVSRDGMKRPGGLSVGRFLPFHRAKRAAAGATSRAHPDLVSAVGARIGVVAREWLHA